MKIVYCGFDYFVNCLSALSDCHYEVVEVFAFKGDGHYNMCNETVARAEHIGCPVRFRPINTEDVMRMERMGVDLLIAAAYPYKIPVRGIRTIRGINIHPSLLPKGRGPWPLPYFILQGLSKGGVTIHKLSEHFDSGDILLQEAFDIDARRETMESLSMKVRLVAQKLLLAFLKAPSEYWKAATPQLNGEYWPMPSAEQQTINWDRPVTDIDRLVRAYGKCDCIARIDGRQYVVQDATVWEQRHEFRSGEVVMRSSRELLVAASDGFVCIRFYNLDPDIIGTL